MLVMENGISLWKFCLLNTTMVICAELSRLCSISSFMMSLLDVLSEICNLIGKSVFDLREFFALRTCSQYLICSERLWLRMHICEIPDSGLPFDKI